MEASIEHIRGNWTDRLEELVIRVLPKLSTRIEVGYRSKYPRWVLLISVTR